MAALDVPHISAMLIVARAYGSGAKVRANLKRFGCYPIEERRPNRALSGFYECTPAVK